MAERKKRIKIDILGGADQTAALSADSEISESIFDDVLQADYQYRKRITSDRSGGEKTTHTLSDNEVLEVILSDGSIVLFGESEIEELFAANGVGKNDSLDIASAIVKTQTSRGASKSATRAINSISVALPEGAELERLVKELIEDHGSSVVEHGTRVIVDKVSYYLARKLEKKLASNGTSRLCKLDVKHDVARLLTKVGPRWKNTSQVISEEASDAEWKKELEGFDAKPILILIHGTLSSTEGSFGDLWSEGSVHFDRIRSHYGERIFSFEHCTLTESPIENALQLARCLPDDAVVHLLTHSRGGLVGELLCRSTRPTGEDAFSQDERALFEEEIRAISDANKNSELLDYKKQELQQLEALNKEITGKNLKVERFVRVACPARGTTLASRKLGRWANRAFNAIGLIPPLKQSLLYRAFRTFAIGVINTKNKAELLPGLQAQMPDSALIHLLNGAGAPVEADLSVVAGDIEVDSRWDWKQVPIWASDQFYGGDHDLIVNTASMDGGTQRIEDISVLPVKGEHVNHFSYFLNKDSAAQIVNRLAGMEDMFTLQKPALDVVIPRSTTTGGSLDKPKLILLPGIMGSTIESRGDVIWANMFRIGLGGLNRITIESNDVTSENVLSLAYGAFIRKFSHSHDLEIFPYDWRKSLTEAADLLAQSIRLELDRQETTKKNRPIRIVAHSMGGLVARTMIGRNNDIWQSITQRSGSKLIMAGTPSRGSYSITRAFTGDMRLINMLAMADLRNSKKDLLEIMLAYPGMAAMLPDFGELNWLNEETWDALSDDLQVPTEQLLREAQVERAELDKSPIDPNHMIYVAGVSDDTPCNATINNQSLDFEYTMAGDGQVTWNEGIPSGLTNVWYQNSVHGSLLADTTYFNAWDDLLNSGTTTALDSKAPRSGTRGELRVEQAKAKAREVIDFLPDEETIARVALGMQEKHSALPEVVSPTLKISVIHGDLAFAKYPVAVGHHVDDSITHAERALDEFLDFRLTVRHAAGQYPGKIGSNDVLFRKSEKAIPEGAIIVGLGVWGELTAAKLERSLTKAITRYIIEYDEWQETGESRQQNKTVGLSALLIGSGVGAVSIHDSISSLIRAVQKANKSISNLPNSKMINPVSEIELIELWEDLALEAIQSLREIDKDNGKGFSISEQVDTMTGGQKRSMYRQSTEWWHTISVEESGKGLKYNNYTRRARNEILQEDIDVDFIDHYVSQIIGNTDYAGDDNSTPNKTLFELLLPQAIKDASPDTDRVRLVLDKYAARFPWEMLIDGWSEKRQPLAISKEIIRQLATEEYRERPQPALKKNALVVGDPPAGKKFGRLPGARQEAKSVAKKLESAYTVQRLIGEETTPDDSHDLSYKIVDELMSQEYSILHFAAHGQYFSVNNKKERDGDKQGMAIGPDLWLTPRLIHKMRVVPALVFLNCCYLGMLEPEENVDQQAAYNRIAGNLATEFIQMGSKVVIAAGWAVDDDAAEQFAEKFYKEMLSNKTFAQACKAARQTTFKEFENSNTFGAYQCWGDPEFRLDLRDSDVKPEAVGNHVIYYSAQEFEIEAFNIRQRASAGNDAKLGRLKGKLDQLMMYYRNNYGAPESESTELCLPKTKALVALGRAYAEIGEFHDAIGLLRSAITKNSAAISGKDYQQLGNFECRLAVQLALNGGIVNTDTSNDAARIEEDPIDLVNKGRNRIEQQLNLQVPEDNSKNHEELYCMLGSAYKRTSMILEGAQNDNLLTMLEGMWRSYGVAWVGCKSSESMELSDIIDLAHKENKQPEKYAFPNFMVAIIVYNWFSNSDRKKAKRRKYPDYLVGALRQLANEYLHGDRVEDLWSKVIIAEVMLILLLDERLREHVPIFQEQDLVKKMEATYKDASRRFGSGRKWLSVYDQLRFVGEMLSKKPNQTKHDLKLIVELEELEEVVADIAEK